MSVPSETHSDRHNEPTVAVSRIAVAIGEPARARMLFCLMDGRARTSTELSLVAGVSPSTASAHLAKLRAGRLVRVQDQGRHRYYRLHGPDVASIIESLSALAGAGSTAFTTRAPVRLRAARVCYDHLAGTLGVQLHDRLLSLGWLAAGDDDSTSASSLTAVGRGALAALDVELETSSRRRLVSACLDWSERRNHVGGVVGAALLTLALDKRWLARDRDSRALRVTPLGAQGMARTFGLRLP